MVFIIDQLKYDTDKMELISDKCEYSWIGYMFTDTVRFAAKDVKLYRSIKGRWLLTYIKSTSRHFGEALTEHTAKELLLKYDVAAYEKIFGELEEA